MTDIDREISPGYLLRSASPSDFDSEFLKLAKKYYDDETLCFDSRKVLSYDEKNKIELLSGSSEKLFKLRLGIYFEGRLIGWSYSRQDSSESLYMQNSGVIPEHRRKGLYSKLVRETLSVAKEAGFQSVWSLHRTTNNSVVIPKLKAGFIITGMDVSDSFGTRVKLTYYFNTVRRKVMDYRVGQIRTDDELMKILS